MAPNTDQDLQRALQLLSEAAALDPKLAEVYNERGEVHLSLGDIAEARRQFAKAVEFGQGHNANLYRYYCNQSNSHTRDPATLAQETPATRQKLNVRSLAWLKHHVDTKSEESLVKCQKDLTSSLEFSEDYEQSAKKVFDYAAELTWEDGELHRESQELQEAFEALLDR